MIFSNYFGVLGVMYLTVSLVSLKSNYFNRIFFKAWGVIPPKGIYWQSGIISILCGLILDFYIWLYLLI